MPVLVTGAAGFIGYHLARHLAERGEAVIGVDNLSDYYSTELKRRRLAELNKLPGFEFLPVELSEKDALPEAVKGKRIGRIIHLAAQANVRNSIAHPHAYIASNVAGHLNVLEYCRHSDTIERLVYASSSSVYGGTKVPFSEADVTDEPASLYAVTKKTAEMTSAVYADLFGIPQVGLRFFSVYGPWGRPDMAYWLFTDAILAGRPIKVFNNGEMQRDFTYIDDIVAGVVAALDAPAIPPHSIYNIGNSRPVALLDMIHVLEAIIGRPAQLEMMPAQPGETAITFADVSAIERDFGFRPSTGLQDGLTRFVEWYRWYHGV